MRIGECSPKNRPVAEMAFRVDDRAQEIGQNKKVRSVRYFWPARGKRSHTFGEKQGALGTPRLDAPLPANQQRQIDDSGLRLILL
jgi:hypothetical protein